MAMRSHRVPSRSGLTLIELMIVVTIIGVLTGIALWKVDIARYQINGDMQSVGTALIAAQRESIAKQHNIIVAFDNTNSMLRIIWDANNNGQLDAGERSRLIALGDRVRYGYGTATPMTWGNNPIDFTGVEGTSGNPAVTFYRNGSASEAGGVYLTSTRAQSASQFVRDIRAIHVERATGRAEWYHFDGSTWVRGF